MLVRKDPSKCNPEHRLKVHKRFIQHTTYPRDIIGRYSRCDKQRERERARHTHTVTLRERERESTRASERASERDRAHSIVAINMQI